MKTLLAIVALLTSVSAYALDYDFKFKVNSSGAYFYACNAGLRQLPYAQRVCYRPGHFNNGHPNDLRCNPSEEGPNCVCTGGRGGEYLMNYMKFNLARFDSPYTSRFYTRKSGQRYFSQIFPTHRFGTRIDKLSFNFGSERYGAEYFVDICYQGPQIEYYRDRVPAKWTVKASNIFTDITGRHPYSRLAGAIVDIKVACDTQAHGRLRYAHNSYVPYPAYPVYDSLHYSNIELNIFNPRHYGNGFYRHVPWRRVTNAMTFPINSTYYGYNSPRFCMFRYTFRETNRNWLRKWQRQESVVTLWQSVEESIDEVTEEDDN